MAKLDPQVQAAIKDAGKTGFAHVEANQGNMEWMEYEWIITTAL